MLSAFLLLFLPCEGGGIVSFDILLAQAVPGHSGDASAFLLSDQAVSLYGLATRSIRNSIVNSSTERQLIGVLAWGQTIANDRFEFKEAVLMSESAPGNLLKEETNPYLRQHALDPVDWHPWSSAVLASARRDQRPILLSIGYSACHWCHVMQRESFQNESIARLMNDNFLCIKVDREERPDLDDIYQWVALEASGQGGWPLTVFLTPQAEPFFVGTYFPPEDRYGRMGFPAVLRTLAHAWQDERAKVQETAQGLTRAIVGQTAELPPSLSIQLEDSTIGQQTMEEAERYLMAQHDVHSGGFGTAPKFPCAGILQFFLQRCGGNQALLHAITNTLDHMDRGGIYDQLGGGFHRYSTDERWLVPHFEKMLYDNALLAQIYLSVYQITGKAEYGQVTREILDYLLRDMWHMGGAFYSTQDADSDGEEGRFYTWNKQEIIDVLGGETGAMVCRYYGVTERGNTEDGRSVLHRAIDLGTLAKGSDLNEAEIGQQLSRARRVLWEKRQERVQPFRDEKIITAWNGMAISALARSGSALQAPLYLDKAKQVAEFIISNMQSTDGRLCRSIKDATISVAGFLEDYGYFIGGLLDLYSATLELVWLSTAVELLDLALELFWDDDTSTFYDTEVADDLLFRPTSPEDASFPSAVGVMARNLLYLQNLLADDQIPDKLAAILGRYLPDMAEHPWSFASLLAVLDLAQGGLSEIFIVGPVRDEEYQRLLQVLHTSYLPGAMIYGAQPLGDTNHMSNEPWQDKSPIDGRPTVYVCQGYTCRPPITEADELRSMLCHLYYRGILTGGV